MTISLSFPRKQFTDNKKKSNPWRDMIAYVLNTSNVSEFIPVKKATGNNFTIFPKNAQLIKKKRIRGEPRSPMS